MCGIHKLTFSIYYMVTLILSRGNMLFEKRTPFNGPPRIPNPVLISVPSFPYHVIKVMRSFRGGFINFIERRNHAKLRRHSIVGIWWIILAKFVPYHPLQP